MLTTPSISSFVLSPESSVIRPLVLCYPAPRPMDDLESKVEEGVVKVRYQYFRQLIPTKEVLA